ncbi:type 4a pilus biogenesis protein PilO [Fuchsiella alkaliacetigena]|uniref:type 4a pilus biogenesis protein PilO n=1 Tax=Fuchsiella alkaliacetigena TaxID=957042 RepID=UPI00200B72CA|nr:type 4a pilus biogenesis protein PilO [Fuchsiella alkaliacetigena]MCK8825288.1 type 4a pilus biogenesis protein PilO [Fuchsiella alkaliacetigena]
MEFRELTAREKKLLIIFLIVVVVAVVYYFFYAPQWEKRMELEAKVEAKLQELEFSSFKLRRIKLLREEIELLEELRRAGVEFLEVGQRNRMVVDLDESALAADLELLSITPASSREEDQYLQYPVNLVLKGEYSGFLDFIKQLAEFDYLVQINSLDISSPNLSTELNLELEVAGYAFREEED